MLPTLPMKGPVRNSGFTTEVPACVLSPKGVSEKDVCEEDSGQQHHINRFSVTNQAPMGLSVALCVVSYALWSF